MSSRQARRSPVAGENRRIKQLYLSALMVLLAAWIVVDVTAPSAAERLDDAVAYAHKHAPKGYRVIGDGSIEIAANEDHDLPQEIIDARTKGQQAREKAIKEAIGKIFPKEGDWGMGGPIFPVKVAMPKQRPVEMASVPTTAIYDFSPLPAVAPPSNPWIGPEDLFPGASQSPIPLRDLPTLSEVRDTAERHHIRVALDKSGGRVDEAARLLGISRSTLFEKMRKLAVQAQSRS